MNNVQAFERQLVNLLSLVPVSQQEGWMLEIEDQFKGLDLRAEDPSHRSPQAFAAALCAENPPLSRLLATWDPEPPPENLEALLERLRDLTPSDGHLD